VAIGIGAFMAVIGAAVALGVTGLSSAIGLRAAGVSGAGAVAENQENFKNALVLQSLPQTQTIYGFITALFIVMGAGLLGTTGQEVTMFEGLVMLGSGIIVAMTGLSAILQGMVASSGIISSSKNQKAFVPSIVFTGQVETPAIFGFITALIVLVVGLHVLG
jgi:V/A-type H+-transporting ATPase subunit K